MVNIEKTATEIEATGKQLPGGGAKKGKHAASWNFNTYY